MSDESPNPICAFCIYVDTVADGQVPLERDERANAFTYATQFGRTVPYPMRADAFSAAATGDFRRPTPTLASGTNHMADAACIRLDGPAYLGVRAGALPCRTHYGAHRPRAGEQA